MKNNYEIIHIVEMILPKKSNDRKAQLKCREHKVKNQR